MELRFSGHWLGILFRKLVLFHLVLAVPQGSTLGPLLFQINEKIIDKYGIFLTNIRKNWSFRHYRILIAFFQKKKLMMNYNKP